MIAQIIVRSLKNTHDAIALGKLIKGCPRTIIELKVERNKILKQLESANEKEGYVLAFKSQFIRECIEEAEKGDRNENK